MRMRSSTLAIAILTATAVSAQNSARDALQRGQRLWEQRLSRSAIAALETAAADRATAAEAQEALGRLYLFKGWQQEAVFPGWHDEPAFRERAIAALKASLASDPGRASAQDALRTAEGFAAADAVPPAAPRPEVAALDAKLDGLRQTPSAPLSAVIETIDARIAIQS